MPPTFTYFTRHADDDDTELPQPSLYIIHLFSCFSANIIAPFGFEYRPAMTLRQEAPPPAERSRLSYTLSASLRHVKLARATFMPELVAIFYITP